MLEILTGVVESYRSVSKRTVQIKIKEVNKLIEMTTYDPWVIDKNDKIVVSGEIDKKTGKFIAYAYKNISKGVSGAYEVSTLGALMFILAGFIFIWAVFPIIHIYLGFKMLGKRKLSLKAQQMVANA